jgi:predicted lipoprotein with Yx(FWY)xxD motif
MRHRRWMPAAFAVFAIALTACGSSGSAYKAAGTPSTAASSPSSQAASASTATLKSAKTSLGTVLTNSKGFTVYWFAIDTATSSKCTGGCTTYWPPVAGAPKASAGVTLPGKLGTITRPDGTVQATYNGHPLYTYSGDSSAGQTSGNKVSGSGGLWYAVTLSGSAGAGASSAPATTSGGGGGGGY